MASGSIIGFAVVFFICTWLVSAVAGLCLRLLMRPLKDRGAGAEKRAAAVALILPPVVGGLVTAALAGYSVVGPWFGAVDHCDSHGHHLHLCLVHGGAWAHTAWSLALVSALSALIVVRLARLGESLWRGHRRLQVVRGSCQRIEGTGTPVFLAPSRRDFCFVAGVRSPRIYVSASLWHRLSSDEREAMLEHERMHVANGDLWISIALSALAVFAAPLVAVQYKRLWSESTERFCDRLAADSRQCSEAMASALLNLARGPRHVGAMSFLPKPESVEDRIIAVLGQERTGRRFALQIAWSTAGLVAVMLVATTLLADPLHHMFETLLGLV